MPVRTWIALPSLLIRMRVRINQLLLKINFSGGQFCKFMQETTNRLDRLHVPVITRVNGVAYGGGSELSTIGDIRIASPNTKVAFVHKKMALQPGWGGASRLIHLVGRQTAAELFLTARVVSSDELLK